MELIQNQPAETFSCTFQFATKKRRTNSNKNGGQLQATEINHCDLPHLGRVPRVSRLMALAIRLDVLVKSGQVDSLAELAGLAHVSRPRITQIMNLNHLDPAIQEEILFLPAIYRGRDPICERHLRPISAKDNWEDQKRMWKILKQNRLA